MRVEEVLQPEVEAGSDAQEAALVEAAIRNDVQAFAALYDRHVTRVFRYVYYWVGNRADAEDVTQQVFLNAWRAIGSYRRTGASFVAWLLRIAHNLVVSFHRAAKDTCYYEVEPASGERWTDPEAVALVNHDRQAVRRTILKLKTDQQAVVTMRFMAGLDYTDIAAALGKTEGHVRVIQHRALNELRRLLLNEVIP